MFKCDGNNNLGQTISKKKLIGLKNCLSDKTNYCKLVWQCIFCIPKIQCSAEKIVSFFLSCKMWPYYKPNFN